MTWAPPGAASPSTGATSPSSRSSRMPAARSSSALGIWPAQSRGSCTGRPTAARPGRAAGFRSAARAAVTWTTWSHTHQGRESSSPWRPTARLLRSADGGQSWLPSAATESKDEGSAQLAFLPDRPDTAILVQTRWAETSVLQSTDGGATWSDVSASGWPNGPVGVRSMLALPRGVLLLNTDAGTYRSADAGARWQPLEGALSSGFVRAWAAPGTGGQTVLAATDYGLFASSDAGALWRAYGTGLPHNSGVAALLTQKDRPAQIVASLLAPGGSDPPELLLTRDAGRTWLPADGGAQWSEATAWAIDPNNPGQPVRRGPRLRRSQQGWRDLLEDPPGFDGRAHLDCGRTFRRLGRVRRRRPDAPQPETAARRGRSCRSIRKAAESRPRPGWQSIPPTRITSGAARVTACGKARTGAKRGRAPGWTAGRSAGWPQVAAARTRTR